MPGASHHVVVFASSLTLVLCGASPSNAQFDRYGSEIELKRLDFHPSGSYRPQVGSQIYGAVDLALTAASRADTERLRCGPQPQAKLDLRALNASFIGIRGTETLDRGWLVHARFEHGFEADRKRRAVDGCAFWDRAATVGVSRRDLGRVDLGLKDQPAWLVSLMADPWSGSAIASPGTELAYRMPQDIAIEPKFRTSNAITYSTPEHLQWAVQLQGSVESGQTRQSGASLRYNAGAWRLAAGWQRWNNDSHVLPIAAVLQLDALRASMGLTFGRQQGKDYRNLLVAAAIVDRGHVRLGEYRIGLDFHHADNEGRQWKAGFGYVRFLSRATAVQTELAVGRGHQMPTYVRGGIGIRHSFAL